LARGKQRPMGTRHMDMTQGKNKIKRKDIKTKQKEIKF